MKYIFIALSILPLQAYCQDDEMEYLIQRKDSILLSGFFSFHSGITSMYGKAAYMNSGGLAALFSQKYYFGFFGTSSVADPARTIERDGKNVSVLVKQKNNGLWLGYISDYQKKLHWASSFQIGFGSVFMIDEAYKDLIDYDDSYTPAPYFNESSILSLRPQIEYEMNVFKWMKINAGAGYQYTLVFDDNYENIDLSSPFFNLKFMFGVFNKSYTIIFNDDE
jgi:hypothetical protein